MSEFVWSTADALLADGRWHMRLNRGEAWWADDPLVAAYPQYFSATPLSVQGTTGRPMPGITSVTTAPKSAGVPSWALAPAVTNATVPAVAKSGADLAAENYGVPALKDPSIEDPTPVMDAISAADAEVTRATVAAVRRGPGRPRKDQPRG